ncbi:MAG: type VI secretion system protein TssL, long form [Rubrivivax sp.]|jgi:type VI secretion system protein ImpK
MNTPVPPADDGQTRIFKRRAQPEASAALPVDAREIGALAAINPLVAAANPLLLTMSSLRFASAPSSAQTLREKLLAMVADFDAACERAAVSTEQRHLARYALCTAVDEAVQRTPWSGNIEWARQGLLVHHFREHNGGEKFFQILDRLMQTPDRHPWLLQLMYVCLALGFMGRYWLDGAEGRAAVNELRERVYQLIRQGQREPERVLSTQWQGLHMAARQFKGFAAVWAVAGGVVLLCLLVFIGLRTWLGIERDALELSKLHLAPVKAQPAPPLPANRPRLAYYLREELKAGQLAVEENRWMSKVTLLSEAAFDSGSAVPRRDAQQLMARIAEELDKVDGQVMVVGHTDNVPLRTLAHENNYELSRDRARWVAQMIRGRLKQPDRVRDDGRGEAEPVADNKTAEGRAKNRRVEITLRVPGELTAGEAR